jgi:CDP-diacylglycerol--serine O-phosphatidyltransferase
MGKARQFRHGIYLLPTLFTVGNLFCGYASVIQSLRGSIEQAAVLIIIAGVLDGLDGRIARFTGTSSDFGREFDSLADIVSFGVAPAVLAFQWGLGPMGRVGWLIAFIFVVCAAMRLARFNVKVSADKRHFAGLPSPMAAGVVASAAFAFPELPAAGWLSVALTLGVAAVALLMVSRFRYRSFKDMDLANRRPFIYVLPLAVILVAVATQPKWSLLLLSSGYLVSAPAVHVWTLVRRSRRGVAEEAEVADEPAYR